MACLAKEAPWQAPCAHPTISYAPVCAQASTAFLASTVFVAVHTCVATTSREPSRENAMPTAGARTSTRPLRTPVSKSKPPMHVCMPCMAKTEQMCACGVRVRACVFGNYVHGVSCP